MGKRWKRRRRRREMAYEYAGVDEDEARIFVYL
jgi:hypothetical protein